MTNSEQVLLDLIKNTLFGEIYNFPIDTNWDEVVKIAKEQTVAGLVIYSLPKAIKSKYEQELYAVSANTVQIMHAQDELLRLFRDKNIPFAILKGSAVAVYYPIPHLRTMGDIDLIVPQDMFVIAKEILQGNGYLVCDAESRHIAFRKDSFYYELHHHFSYDGLDIEKYIIKGMENLEIASINNHFFPILPRLANGMVLLAHIWEHLQSGLGLRQVIDWMMYVDKKLDNEFWESEFKVACDELGLTTLAITTTRLCQMYLGLNSQNKTWCAEADETLCRDLLENLLLSGNFGHKHGTGHSFETIATAIRKDGLFRYLQYAGEINWQVSKKHKWLRPFAWLYQIGRYVRQGISIKRGRIEIINDFERGRDRYSLLKRLGVIDSQMREMSDKTRKRQNK